MHKYTIYEKRVSVLNVNAEVSKVAVVHCRITGLYWFFFSVFDVYNWVNPKQDVSHVNT